MNLKFYTKWPEAGNAFLSFRSTWLHATIQRREIENIYQGEVARRGGVPGAANNSPTGNSGPDCAPLEREVSYVLLAKSLVCVRER